MKILFMLLQMVVLTIVYIFIYTAYRVVQLSIEKYDTSVVMYFPVVSALVIFPILLYKYRQMFNSGNMLVAVTWTMGVASLTILALYFYIAQISG
jgi:hypothetical protein